MNTYKIIEDANKKFNLHFRVNALRFMDPLMTYITKRYQINAIAFDDWLHHQGYTEEDHGSMKDYIKNNFGNEALKFIINLLLIRPRVIKRRKQNEQI